jgi:uncharacterized membrane protein HdeD (DUF308 family)
VLKRLLARQGLALGIIGGIVCLIIGLFFMWTDGYLEAGSLAVASLFAALFIASGIVGDWLERRQRRGPARGFKVKQNEAEENLKGSGQP